MTTLKRYCSGCGARLQNEHEHELGYVKDITHTLCVRCFQLKHYNVSTDDILKTHFPILPDGAFIVYMVSILHINTLLKYDLSKFYPNSKVIVLINFIDLLPKTINFDLWVRQIKTNNVLEVMPISALKGTYLDVFLETIDHYNPKGDTYFVGLQNSGKSTLFNQIAKSLSLDIEVLTALKPGLTIDNIKIPYQDRFLIDTPGIYEQGFIGDFLPYQDYQSLMPKKPFKPKTYQVTQPIAFIIGGVAIISIIKGYPMSVTFYLNAPIHRTKYQGAYALLEKHKGTLFSPVIEAPFMKSHLKTQGEKKYIINIYDIGFLVISNATVEILAPKNANITIKEGHYHGL